MIVRKWCVNNDINKQLKTLTLKEGKFEVLSQYDDIRDVLYG